MVATRHMEEQVGNVKLVRQMSKEKNALAGSRTFQYIAQRPGTKELLLMMNCLGDAHHWSENTCWIFDADFEYLRNDSVVYRRTVPGLQAAAADGGGAAGAHRL